MKQRGQLPTLPLLRATIMVYFKYFLAKIGECIIHKTHEF